MAAAFMLAIGTVACGSDTKPSSAPTITQAPAPAATVVAVATTTTAAPTTTAAATITTEAATTTAAPRTAVVKGTFVGIPEALLPGPPAADGWVTVTGATAWDGDLIGQEAYTAAFSPADAAGVITERADVTFTGTLVGVGDGSFSWHEADHSSVEDGFPGSAPVVGVSGVFEGATGTLSWTHIDDNSGTYEVDLVWA
jgi:hypothetical protein